MTIDDKIAENILAWIRSPEGKIEAAVLAQLEKEAPAYPDVKLTEEQLAAFEPEAAEIVAQDPRREGLVASKCISQRLANARAASGRYGPAELRAMLGEKAALEHRKGSLAWHERVYLKKIREELRHHPCTLPYYELALLLGSRVPGSFAGWLPQYIREQGWHWLWWAEYFGESVESYVSKNYSWKMAAIEESKPMPEGWTPPGRE